MGSFKVEDGKILLDGNEFQFISGAIHYFRVHPGYWRDRLVKLKQCGMNCVETYIDWQLHEQQEGKLEITEYTDFVRFIRIAEETGLKVIIRPGPYITSELDLGGLPGWLLRDHRIRLRSTNPAYLKYVDRYIKWALGLLKELQYTENGPVIMVQIENEYGYYGNEHAYMEHLKNLFLQCGITVPLFTSDGPGEPYLNGGSLPGVPVTGNFRKYEDHVVSNMRKYQEKGPDICMELHNGYIQCWGMPRFANDTESVRFTVKKFLEKKFSFNVYAFHGGTSFGFISGGCSRENLRYRPFCTSYDVDAPLSEDGVATEKYFMYQKELGTSAEKPVTLPRRAYGEVELTRTLPLLEALPQISAKHLETYPKTMEDYGQSFGFILYRFTLPDQAGTVVALDGLQDRAVVMMNGVGVGTIYCLDPEQKVTVFPERLDTQIDILVENMGRRCGTHLINDERKGVRNIRLMGQSVSTIEIYPLPLNDVSRLRFSSSKIPLGQAAFYQGDFEVDAIADTFLRIPHGVRGVCWINGFNLGRYWEIGPQRTLYVPAPVLKRGENVITVFEVHGMSRNFVRLEDFHDLGPKSHRQSY